MTPSEARNPASVIIPVKSSSGVISKYGFLALTVSDNILELSTSKGSFSSSSTSALPFLESNLVLLSVNPPGPDW